MNWRWAISNCPGVSWSRERKRRLRAGATVLALQLAGFALFPFLARAQREAERFQMDPVEHAAVWLLAAFGSGRQVPISRLTGH